MKVEFVDSQRDQHGVQPVLAALKQTPAEIAPSTYYAAKARPEPARAARDRELVAKIEQVQEDNYSVYGARKGWAELNRQGLDVARCMVERLMRETGLRGLLRDKSPRTTKPAAETGRPGDLVERDFTATGPNELWVADLTYVRAAAGWGLRRVHPGRVRPPDRRLAGRHQPAHATCPVRWPSTLDGSCTPSVASAVPARTAGR
ncbi:IS3 family transposase [Actinophytocola sp.]|uniref:IS3 family transposase n=1 Tax=Actinophytocola sp. TaxID=1872138 RepID=UPI003D6AA66F